MLAKVVKLATAPREANYSRGTINIRDDYSSMDNKNISKTARSDRRKASNSRKQSTFNRNISRRNSHS